jgi:hypothetical protein
MQRIPVESSSIASIGYDPRERVLELEFRQSGDVYQYFDVPGEEYTAFLAADSKGTYVNQQLKPWGYRHQRLPVLIEISSHSCSQVSTYSLRGHLPLNSSGRCQHRLDNRTLTKVLQNVAPHQEVMTHIDVGDNTQRRSETWCVRIDSNSPRPFKVCGCRRRCRAKP